MQESALGSVFFFRGRNIGLDNYKSKESLSRPAMGSQVVIILMEKFLKNYQEMMQEKW